jgi:hypothetical protein
MPGGRFVIEQDQALGQDDHDVQAQAPYGSAGMAVRETLKPGYSEMAFGGSRGDGRVGGHPGKTRG